jgi:hypothetical protein
VITLASVVREGIQTVMELASSSGTPSLFKQLFLTTFFVGRFNLWSNSLKGSSKDIFQERADIEEFGGQVLV